MIFNTQFSNGDKAWCVVNGNKVRELTVGRVGVELTCSNGIEGENLFDNYKPQNEYEERYMCVETGIGSGSVYEIGKNIFHSKELADKAVRTGADNATDS